MHGILDLGWVPDRSGGYGGQMAVYVKPNGYLGTEGVEPSAASALTKQLQPVDFPLPDDSGLC